MLSTFCFLSFYLIKHLLITYFLYAAIYEKIMKPILNTCKNTALGDECMCQRMIKYTKHYSIMSDMKIYKDNIYPMYYNFYITKVHVLAWKVVSMWIFFYLCYVTNIGISFYNISKILVLMRIVK